MTLRDRSARRLRQREARLDALEPEHPGLSALDDGQRWVLYAMLQVLDGLAEVPLLQHVVAFLLLHCGMHLKHGLLSGVLGVSVRSLHEYKVMTPQALVAHVRRPPHGKRPKLLPAHVGPIARFIVEHPQASQADLQRHLCTELHVDVERHTLAAYLRRYSLDTLRPQEPPHLFVDLPSLAAPSS